MLHVLIMLFSSLEASEENSSRIEKMEAKISAAQRNVIYFLGNENENVSQRTRDIRSLLGYDSLLFHSFFCAFSIYDNKKRGKGLKRFRDNIHDLHDDIYSHQRHNHPRLFSSKVEA